MIGDDWYYKKFQKSLRCGLGDLRNSEPFKHYIEWQEVKNDPGLYIGTIYQENTKITFMKKILVITNTKTEHRQIKNVLKSRFIFNQIYTHVNLRMVNDIFDIKFLAVEKDDFDWCGVSFDKIIDLSTMKKSEELNFNIKCCTINNPDIILVQDDKYEELLDELANALDKEEVNAIFPWYDDEEDDMTGCGWCIRDCDGKDSSGKCPEVCDSESCDSEGCGENKKCCQEKKCECGAASCGSSAHSSYCPLYEP